MTDRNKKLQRARRGALKKLGLRIEPGRRIKLADGYYRLRRGKLVRIPDEWLGRPLDRCEPGMAKWRRYKLSVTRPSKMGTKKMRRRLALKDWGRVPREKRADHRKRRKMGSHPKQRTPRHLRRRRRQDEWDELV